MKFQTNEEAQNACVSLQVLMGLQDWTVVVEFDEDLKGTGRVYYQFFDKTATIKLRRSGENHMQTLMHELLHIQWSWIDAVTKKNDKLVNMVLEQTVCKAARAMYQLFEAGKRQNNLQEDAEAA